MQDSVTDIATVFTNSCKFVPAIYSDLNSSILTIINIYIYIYICLYLFTYIYIYIYMYFIYMYMHIYMMHINIGFTCHSQFLDGTKI